MAGLALAPLAAGELGLPHEGGSCVLAHAGHYAPVNFIYRSFHNSIRSELDSLSESVLALESLAAEDGLLKALEELKGRYRFLEQVYKFHSSLEDEVIYPALDAKVKNVTLAYTLEHEDEERLFEQLSHLLSLALLQQGHDRSAVLRELGCKIEEVHTTLRNHLAKEEEQLLPLLLQHFTVAEQAELVAQFLCCIPLATVDVVLSWLKPTLPEQEQAELLAQVRGVVDDQLLLQLLVTWLSPKDLRERAKGLMGKPAIPAGCCRTLRGSEGVPCPLDLPGCRPLLQHITHLHGAIRSALDSFAAEAHGVLKSGSCGSATLAALAERHRFLRNVCSFHSASENDVLFPVARQLLRTSGGGGGEADACATCEADHDSETSLLEDLGRQLTNIRASIRRGAREAEELLGQLCGAVDAARSSIVDHMEREEASLLPVLVAHLCVAEQRAMVWGTLQAMPLRLLERVLPWLSGKLTDGEVEDLLSLIKLAAPEVDSVLAELLSMWIQRGRSKSPEPKSSDDPELYVNETCGTHLATAQSLQSAQTADVDSPPAKRARVQRQSPFSNASLAGEERRTLQQVNPIDHIFQFHKALRRDLHALESDTRRFVAAVEEADTWSAAHLQQVEGQFRFLWGIYQAHSDAEDEIVFPALEKKEALHNVSHAYTLDHLQEAQLFREVDEAFKQLRHAESTAEVLRLGRGLQRSCAAMRASLEQHVRAEEQELWPLFAENFTTEEQEHLVGLIIGRTGADALSSMLPWVTGSFTEEEKLAMMESLRSATKNTMFERWLDATMAGAVPVQDSTSEAAAVFQTPPPVRSIDALMDVAPYFGSQSSAGGHVDASGQGSSGTVFRPGWEHLFRMNQAALEQAIRRVSADPGLDQDGKAYLMQNIMASRYIVATQKRLTASPRTPGPTFHNRAAAQLGCQHYRRNCQLEAPCCSRVYTCRRCHDDAEDHLLDVTSVTHMVCMACSTRQPCAASCSVCGVKEARYFCAICKLWDDDPTRDIYHCPFCNLCRLGKGLGMDNCHCMKCNVCMHLDEFQAHTCRDVASCPVCTERLFDSNLPYRVLPCGHAMHSHCFSQHTRYNYTCPLCAKSVGDMSVYFRMIDSLIDRDRAGMPPAYALRTQPILCNDCGAKSNAPFHFVYHKCPTCASYNTRLV